MPYASPELFYSTTQIADKLQVSRTTVFRMIKGGVIAATKVGRNYIISDHAIALYILNHQLTPAERDAVKAAMRQLLDELRKIEVF